MGIIPTTILSQTADIGIKQNGMDGKIDATAKRIEQLETGYEKVDNRLHTELPVSRILGATQCWATIHRFVYQYRFKTIQEFLQFSCIVSFRFEFSNFPRKRNFSL